MLLPGKTSLIRSTTGLEPARPAADPLTARRSKLRTMREASQSQSIPLEENLVFRRRPVTSRITFDSLNVRNAAKALEQLPEPGATWHIVMRGNFTPWDVTPAIIRLAGQDATEALFVTYSFSAWNARQLFGMLDAGRIGRAHLVASLVFSKMEPKNWNVLAEGLKERNQPYAAARVHAKIQALRFPDGSSYVMEGSANLRSCRAVEQFTLTNDPELYDFHRSWIANLCPSS